MRLQTEKSVRRFIRSLPDPAQELISQTILDLEDDPYPSNSVELRGHQRYRRIRIGKYRILYRVGKNTVYVHRVEERSGKTYRGFNPGRK